MPALDHRSPVTPPDVFPPAWAARWGEDEYGFHTALVLHGVPFPFRWVPPGTFVMGSNVSKDWQYLREGPPHRVRITRGFWMAETPCTQGQWKAFGKKDPSHFKNPTGQLPVETVSWNDVTEWIAELNGLLAEHDVQALGIRFRLPSEAEWEYACRAGTESDFNSGSSCTNPNGVDLELKKLGWHGEGTQGQTHPVRDREPNRWGLYDMHGNVWEWCADGPRDYSDKSVPDDPVGNMSGQAWRVLRGGSCWDGAWRCRSASRSAFGPVGRDVYIGFRLVAGLELKSQ